MKRRTPFALAGIALVTAGLVWWLSRETARENEVDQSPQAPVGDAGSRAVRTTATALKQASTVDGGLPEAKTGPGNEVARFGWGSGEGNLGRSKPDEANPEAPMSLTVDALGNVWILDQVNERLVKVDQHGKPLGSVPIPVQAGQDVVVTPDGTALVLDRLVDKSIAVIGPDGKPRGDLPIVGKGLSEGGAATGLFSDGDSIYVEREHGDVVRVGGTDGKADSERPEFPGRPAQDGHTFLTANIVDAAQGLVMVTAIERPSQQHRFTRQFPVGAPIVGLNALDSDHAGVIYLGAITELVGSTPEAAQFGITVLCLDPLDGRPIGVTRFAANASPEETFRELTVLPGGGFLFLERTEAGPRVMRYGCGG